MTDTRSIEANNWGRPRMPNRQGLYAKTAKYAINAIETIVKLLESRNEAIRLGAAKALLDKCLPDVKSTREDLRIESPVIIKVVEDIDV